MFPKLNLIYILFGLRILELPEAVLCKGDSIELFETGWEVRCKFQPNSWNCFNNQDNVHRFYYDIKMQSCKTFQYGGCSLSYNSFAMLADCSASCDDVGNYNIATKDMDKLSIDVICQLQPDFGTCFGYLPLYYYDLSTRKCKGFSYSGCGGNRNKFQSQYECMDTCENAMPEYKLSRHL